MQSRNTLDGELWSKEKEREYLYRTSKLEIGDKFTLEKGTQNAFPSAGLDRSKSCRAREHRKWNSRMDTAPSTRRRRHSQDMQKHLNVSSFKMSDYKNECSSTVCSSIQDPQIQYKNLRFKFEKFNANAKHIAHYLNINSLLFI